MPLIDPASIWPASAFGKGFGCRPLEGQRRAPRPSSVAFAVLSAAVFYRAITIGPIADGVRGRRHVSYDLRDAAYQWRTLAVRLDLLQRDPTYQRLRACP